MTTIPDSEAVGDTLHEKMYQLLVRVFQEVLMPTVLCQGVSISLSDGGIIWSGGVSVRWVFHSSNHAS